MLKQLCALTLILFVLFLTGCSKKDNIKDNPIDIEHGKDDAVLKNILREGYDMKDIVEEKDRYVVQGDIIFYKDQPGGKTGHATTEQGRSPYLVAPEYRNINIYLDAGSFSSINLNAIVDNVIAAYNAIGSGIRLTRVFSAGSAHITIVQRNIGTNVCGQAGFPFPNGQPFNNVFISESTLVSNGLTSSSQLTMLVAHELGHCLGLRHTNWQRLGEGAPIGIPSTPVTDGASVMNGASCGAGWAGFSYHDQIAIHSLYSYILGGPDRLNAGDILYPGQLIRSQDGRFILTMQTDGNLVLYYFNVGLWSSNTVSNIPSIATMQTDGNLVVYQNSVGRWSSNTATGIPGVVIMQNDGNLALYQNGVGVWGSNTYGY